LWAIHYMETCRVLSPQWLADDVKQAVAKGSDRYR